MRRRGYDVEANANYGGTNFEYFHAFDVKDSFIVKTNSKDGFSTPEELVAECYGRIFEQCLEYGDGARGALTMRFPLGGGHVINWVVENGEFKLIDAQNTGYDEYETLSRSTFNIEVIRLDNAEILPGSTDFVEVYKPFEKIQKKVEEVIKVIGDSISDFVSRGAEFVKNLFKK